MEWINAQQQQPPNNTKILVVYRTPIPYAPDHISIAAINYCWEEGYCELGRWLKREPVSYKVTHWMIAPILPKEIE